MQHAVFISHEHRPFFIFLIIIIIIIIIISQGDAHRQPEGRYYLVPVSRSTGKATSRRKASPFCFAVFTQRILSFLYIVSSKVKLFGVPSFLDLISLSRLDFTFFFFWFCLQFPVQPLFCFFGQQKRFFSPTKC